MKVLHITNDFAGSKVYHNLCHSLDKLGVQQCIYVPVRSKKLIGNNFLTFKNSKSKIIYSNILSLYTRINYFNKIKRIYEDINSRENVNKFNIIHAHTLFSDGGVAYKLFVNFGIPYIVTVRATDYNLFFKKLFYLRSFGLKILLNAKDIIFVSPTYQTKLYSEPYFKSYLNHLTPKSVLIPNGIHDYWINNFEYKKPFISDPFELIYVGRFIKGKNIINLIKAIEYLNLEGITCRLNLVGGGGSLHNKIIEIIDNNNMFLFHGQINDKDKLKKLYRSSDLFVMPSKKETFGLVYIEALSQGLPILYSINEGVYGYFDTNVGEAVYPNRINSISEGIKKIHDNYNFYEFNIQMILKNHSWHNIASIYLSLYS